MHRNERQLIAQETVQIIERGGYLNRAGEYQDISAAVAAAVRDTRLYVPDELATMRERALLAAAFDTHINVTNESTLAAAQRLVVQERREDVLALNFASAKNPGGGFLSGAQAQEESLARSSALYATLLAKPEYYARNRAESSALYTDHMILSPRVPVFRDDDGTLLVQPYLVSFLTAPAVNAGAVRQNQPRDVGQIEPTMARRSALVLAVAADAGYRDLVLGAWGCGVFRNDPVVVGRIFGALLASGGAFAGRFHSVTFAVLDRERGGAMVTAFRQGFSSGCLGAATRTGGLA